MRKRENTPPPKSAREKLADSLDLSKEILLDTSKIVVIGNREVTIENYRGIIEYTPSSIKLLSNPCSVEICGNCLEIKTMTRDFLYVTGAISCISYLNKGSF